MSSSTTKSDAQPAAPPNKRPKKTRVVRRRGPVRDDDIDEGVIERAALTDEDSEPSNGETDTEDDEDDPHPPATTAKPSVPSETPPVQQPTPPPTDDTTSTTHDTSGPPSQEPSHLWSDAMDDGKAGDEGLPVIDFAELSLVPKGEIETLLKDKAKKPPKGKNKKAKKAAPPAVTTEESAPSPAVAAPTTESTAEASTSASVATTTPTTSSKPKPLPPHMSARQSYMQKLSTDPSYVPRIGQFWGHDDRLMEKDLRGMSDWWRGRWQGRGRGGGRGGFGGRGRGRGGFSGPGSPAADAEPERELEPIDKRWAHDGYEEQLKEDSSSRGGGRGGARGGRGWYKEKRGRGRGGANGAPRQGGPPPKPSEVQAQLQAQAAAKIAGQQVASSSAPSPAPSTPAALTSVDPSTSATVPPPAKPSKKALKAAKHPNAKGKLGAVLAQAAKDRETANATSVVAAAKNEVAAEKAFGPSVTPAASTAPAVPRVNLPKAPKSKQSAPHDTAADGVEPPAPSAEQIAITAAARMALDLPQHQSHGPRLGSEKERTDGIERAILKDSFRKSSLPGAPPSEPAQQSPATSQPPVVLNAPLTTQPSTNPSYSYVSLPPGIAMGESGLLYEIATGRPVVLNQATPPLPAPPVMPMAAPPPMAPMYNPRPMMHPQAGRPMSFVPSQYPPTPPIYGAYAGSPEPSRGTPNFFTPPKSSGRVQIRPPASKQMDAPKENGQAESTSSYRPSQEQAQQQYAAASNYTQQQYPEQYYNSYYSSQVAPAQTNAYAPTTNGATEDPYYAAYYSQQAYGYAPPPVDYSAYAQPPQDGSAYGGYAPQPTTQDSQGSRANPGQVYY